MYFDIDLMCLLLPPTVEEVEGNLNSKHPRHAYGPTCNQLTEGGIYAQGSKKGREKFSDIRSLEGNLSNLAKSLEEEKEERTETKTGGLKKANKIICSKKEGNIL